MENNRALKEESPKTDRQLKLFSPDAAIDPAPLINLVRKAESNPRIMAALLEAAKKIAD